VYMLANLILLVVGGQDVNAASTIS
jgi:hypothetical protein